MPDCWRVRRASQVEPRRVALCQPDGGSPRAFLTQPIIFVASLAQHPSSHDSDMASSSSGSGAPALLGDPFASYSKIFSPTANASLAWRTPKPNSTEGLTAFLDNNPPSKTKSCGQERQIWLINSYKRPETPSAQAGVAARNAIRDIHRDYVELLTACQEINDNEKIPVRANKKQGRSKKTRRDELIVEFEEMMPQVARDNGLSTGRLVLFIERGIDVIVKDLAYSMVKGALSRLPTAKVHAIEVDCVDLKSAGREWQVVSIYFDSIWNRVAAEEVGKALLSQHGQPSGLATSAVHAMLDIINRKVRRYGQLCAGSAQTLTLYPHRRCHLAAEPT